MKVYVYICTWLYCMHDCVLVIIVKQTALRLQVCMHACACIDEWCPYSFLHKVPSNAIHKLKVTVFPFHLFGMC